MADRFINEATSLTNELNEALSAGKFASISQSSRGRIITISDTLTRMESLLTQVHSDLLEIATEITAAGRAWVEAALEVLAAGLSSDAPRFQEAKAALDQERQRFNLGVRRWNVAVEAA